MAADSGRDLTHDEVWDDSELLSSWNDAYEEYKKYHSLALQGKKIDAKAPKSSTSTQTQSIQPNGITNPASTSNAPVNFIGPAETETQTNAEPGAAEPPAAAAPPSLATLPQTLLSTGHEENLKNIMMSWYYAGYYTGLYEGQQKAWAEMQAQQQQQQQGE